MPAVQNYEVKIGVFEGPLDLLVYLVQKNELHPRDIPISLITDQFLSYVEEAEIQNLSLSGEFLVMASRLMRLKAQEMLPDEDKDELEMVELSLDKEELIQQMLEYQKFKEVSKYLKHLELRTSGMYKRGMKDRPPKEKPTGPQDVAVEATIYDLMMAFSEATRNRKKPNIHQVEIDDVTIENQIKRLQQQLKRESHFLFDAIYENDPRNVVIVVSFMSLLEMAKLDEIRIFQHAMFGPIWIYDKTKDLDLPHTSLDHFGDFDSVEIKPGLVEYLQKQMEKGGHKSLFDEVIEELEKEMNNPDNPMSIEDIGKAEREEQAEATGETDNNPDSTDGEPETNSAAMEEQPSDEAATDQSSEAPQSGAQEDDLEGAVRVVDIQPLPRDGADNPSSPENSTDDESDEDEYFDEDTEEEAPDDEGEFPNP